MRKDPGHEPNQNEKRTANTPEPQMVRINGFQQILDMLKVADPDFRESLLARIGRQDSRLASSLRLQLKEL